MNRCWRFSKIVWIASASLALWSSALADDDPKYVIRFSGIDVEMDPTTDRFHALAQEFFDFGSVLDSNYDHTDSGIKIADAVMVHKMIGIEVGAAYYGQYSGYWITPEAQYDVHSKTFALQAGVTGRFPLGMVTFYAKLSGSYWREEFDIRGPDPDPGGGDGDGDDGGDGDGDGGDGGKAAKVQVPRITLGSSSSSGVDFSGEVGLELRIAHNLALSVGYEETAINGVDVKAILAGLTYKY